MTLIEIIAEALQPEAELRGGHWMQSVAEDAEYEDVSEMSEERVETSNNE